MKISVEINEKFLETCGSNSLYGALFAAARDNNAVLADLKEVELVFPQTSITWRGKNNGPRQYVLNEYTVYAASVEFKRRKR